MAKRILILTSAVILFLTASAKLFSAVALSAALKTGDPLIEFVSTQQLIVFVAVLELAVVAVLCFGSSEAVKIKLIVWINMMFLLYRLGLWVIGYSPAGCSCLGVPDTWTVMMGAWRMDEITKILLAYMLCSSVWFWWRSEPKSADALAAKPV